MSRNPTDDFVKSVFCARIRDGYEKGKSRGKWKTQKQFGEAVDPPATPGAVSNWMNGTDIPSAERRKSMIDLFEVPDDYFDYDSDDVYRYSTKYTTGLARTEISQFCDEIGLNTSFLLAMRDLFGADFGEHFPVWTQFIRDTDARATEAYKLRDPNMWSTSKEMDEEYRFFQYEVTVEKDGKKEKRLLILSAADLRFLRDVQQDIKDYVELFLFEKRKKERLEELAEVNRRAKIWNGNRSYQLIDLPARELNEIDKYFHEYTDRKKGE